MRKSRVAFINNRVKLGLFDIGEIKRHNLVGELGIGKVFEFRQALRYIWNGFRQQQPTV